MKKKTVALHPEGVDRNGLPSERSVTHNNVALHPEGVDRNSLLFCYASKLRERRPPPGGRG